MKTHIIHFIFLLAILAVGIAAFFAAQGNSSLQFIIGLVTAVSYVVWGMIHHAMEGDLHKKIVIEYVLIAAIAVLLLEVAVGP
ncbi:hypothetical protein HY086_01870 [Candidatus Gottesmanbacteria bacterium]|nr:hypothetical protein [Candidatus Gottesmanbacteria bacterium]